MLESSALEAFYGFQLRLSTQFIKPNDLDLPPTTTQHYHFLETARLVTEFDKPNPPQYRNTLETKNFS